MTTIPMTMIEVDTEQGRVRRYTHDIYPSEPLVLLALPGVTPSREFSTNGWDAVFAIRAEDVNAAIARKGTSPKTWSVDIPGTHLSVGGQASGTFGAWQLTTGGTGGMVRMLIPFDCTVTAGTDQYVIRGGKARVDVKLRFVPPPAGAPVCPSNEESAAGTHELRVQSDSHDPADPPVLIVSVTYESSTPVESGLEDLLTRLLKAYLTTHLADFSHVFATVDLATLAAKDAFQWLKPTDRSYAYAEPEGARTLEGAVFAVLTMTECRSRSGASQAISPDAIPAGARAGFSISELLLMEKMILPNIHHEFPGTTDADFRLNSNATQITNVRQFALSPVRVGAVDYTPMMETLRITVTGDVIETFAHIRTNISPGVDAWADVTHYATLELKQNPDGTQTIGYREVQPPVQRTGHDVAVWVEVVTIAVDIIVGVATFGAGMAVKQIARVVVRVIVSILIGAVVAAIPAVLGKIPEMIAGSLPFPSIDPFVANATSPVKWSDAGDFKITKLVLNRALQMGGDPQFGRA